MFYLHLNDVFLNYFRELSSRFSSCGTQLLFAVSNYDSFFFFLWSKYSLYKQQSLFKCQNASIFGSRRSEPLLTPNPCQVLMAFSPTISRQNIYSIPTLPLFLQKSMARVHCKVWPPFIPLHEHPPHAAGLQGVSEEAV